MRPQLLTILVCGLLLAPAQPSWARKWTDNTGKFSVEAELVEVKNDQVVLKKTDGKVITLPVARLSETDRQHLQSLPHGTLPCKGSPVPFRCVQSPLPINPRQKSRCERASTARARRAFAER